MKEEIMKRALNDFIQYGFKTFTMDDLANKMGISKKTLYEYFPSKNDLVETTLDYALEISCKNADIFVQGEGSVIENVYRNQKKVQEVFNINSDRPIWELQKYYPKTYERMNVETAKADAIFIDKVMERGIQEGLFREDINLKFFKIFYTAVQRMKAQSELFPETEFSFWETIYTIIEYFFRILVNEKGLKELERVLEQERKQKKIN
ncbi:MAG: TetR/AcrR family transcriptional regulator [Capnocytophaga ochracea]